MPRKFISPPNLVARINRKLYCLTPQRYLKFEWKSTGGAYWLISTDNTQPELGPYYWCYLLGLARHIHVFRPHERSIRWFVRTPERDIEEEMIPDRLLFPVVWNEHIGRKRRRSRLPFTATVTAGGTESDGITATERAALRLISS